MKKKVVLFRPRIHRYYRGGGVPLQLLAISRLLAKEDYEIKIITSELSYRLVYPYEEISALILKECQDALCFGTTVMTGYPIRESLDIARLLKKTYKELPIVWGGWHPSCMPEQTISHPDVDIIVIGQGEVTFYEMVKQIERDGDLSQINGIYFKDNRGTIIKNKPREMVSLNEFPKIPYHLVDMEKILSETSIEGKRVLSYFSSVGCPYKCDFCADNVVYQRKWNALSAEKILEEFKELKEHFRIDEVCFVDNNFFINHRRAIDILKGMLHLGLKAYWINARIDHLLKASVEDWSLFSKVVIRFLVGAESGNLESLELIGKNITVEDTKKLIQLGTQYNVSIEISTMVGLPLETKNTFSSEFKRTFRLIKESIGTNFNLHKALLFLYTPYPGTPLYYRSLNLGLKECENLEEWSTFDFGTMVTPWIKKQDGSSVDFINSFVLKLLDPRYKFYFGTNKILVFLINNVVLSIFKQMALLRFKYEIFSFPIEYKLIKTLMNHPLLRKTIA